MITSGSISFDGGTNLLSNYVEGTWSPTISTSGTAPTGVVYNVQVGRYTQIGNKVFYSANISFTSITTVGTGTLRLSLPLTVNASDALSSGNIFLSNCTFAAGTTYALFQATAGQAYGNPNTFGTGTASVTASAATFYGASSIIRYTDFMKFNPH